MKNIVKKLSMIILFTVVSVSFSGCNKSEVNEKEMQDVQMRFEQFIRDNGEEIALEKIDTTDWQEYIDEERGFSFKYPNDWTLNELPYKKHRMYKDCYKLPGTERGGCGDEFANYNIKSTLHPTTFLCLNPNNENLNGDCFITFSQIDPILKNVGTTVDVYDRNYREPIDAQYVKFTDVNDALFFTGATVNDYFKFVISELRMLGIRHSFNDPLYWNGVTCSKIDQHKYSVYQLPHEERCFAVLKEKEEIFYGIIQSINIIKK